MHSESIPIFIIVYPGVQLLDVAGPFQTFVTSEERRLDSPVRALREAAVFDLHLVSAKGGLIKTSSGMAFMTEVLPEHLPPESTLIVVGAHEPDVEAAATDGVLKSWLLKHAPEARRLCSICTGAFLLAEFGLLSGKSATTHWAQCPAFEKRYPNVRLKPNAMYTKDGKVWTSAGISAGIDLALALIEEDRGAGLANLTARWLVVSEKRTGGQSQFSASLELAAKDSENRFAGLHSWIAENLSKDLTLPILAERASMSERSFGRRYKKATGMSPVRAVKLIRAEKAKTLLMTSNASLKTIARQTGFASIEQMNRVLDQFQGAKAQELRASAMEDG